MVVVRDLNEVGLAGDGRNGILTAGPLLTQKLMLNCTYFSCFVFVSWRRQVQNVQNMSSLSMASSGAVVKWDALDDMGNYFLMLGMPVGPLIRADFA